MGAAVLLALGLYFVGVGGVKDDLRRTEGVLLSKVRRLRHYQQLTEQQAADPLTGLPVQPILEYWKTRRKQIEQERKRILAEFRRIDEGFERLFAAGRNNEVRDIATFVSELKRQVEKDIQERYKELLPAEVPFEKVFPIVEPPPRGYEEIPAAQKRFYIGRALAAAAKEAGAVRIEQVSFSFGQGAPPPREEGGARREAGSEGAPGGVRWRALQASMTLRLPARGLPALVSAVIKERIAVMNVVKLEVTKAPFSVAHLAPWKLPEKMGVGAGAAEIVTFQRPVYVADSDQSDPRAKDPPPALDEPPVRAVLTVQVLDFELPADQ